MPTDKDRVLINFQMATVHLKEALCILDGNHLSTFGHETIQSLIDVVESLISVL